MAEQGTYKPPRKRGPKKKKSHNENSGEMMDFI